MSKKALEIYSELYGGNWLHFDDLKKYAVSDTGLIRNYKQKSKSPCRGSYKSKSGYHEFNLHSIFYNGVFYEVLRTSIHRLVWMAHKGPIPKGLEVNHKDANKSNNALYNLELVTRQENMEHAQKNGLFKSGPASEERLECIKLLNSLGWQQNKIARAFGCTPENISGYVKRHDVNKTKID